MGLQRAGHEELYLTKSYEEIINSPLINRTKYNEMARNGYAFLSLSTTMPDYYKEVDPELLAKVSRHQM